MINFRKFGEAVKLKKGGRPLSPYSIHGERYHQQAVMHALIAEDFMWIVRDHPVKGNKNLPGIIHHNLYLRHEKSRHFRRRSIGKNVTSGRGQLPCGNLRDGKGC
jgi:hypothetical protein